MHIRRPTKVRANRAIFLARYFRKQMGITGPVDAKSVLTKLAKLYYFSSAQDPDFANEEGFTILGEDGIYRVYINVDLPEGRDNFTYGHETSHIVLGHHKEFDIDYLSDYEHWILNREADIFTAEYLMPKALVREIISQLPTPLSVSELAYLKNIFGVSWAAMINRLDELKIASKAYLYGLFEKRQSVAVAEARAAYAEVAVADDGFWRRTKGVLEEK